MILPLLFFPSDVRARPRGPRGELWRACAGEGCARVGVRASGQALPELYRNSTGTLPELFRRIPGTLPEHFRNSTGEF